MAKRLVFLSTLTFCFVGIVSAVVIIPPAEYEKWSIYVSFFLVLPYIFIVITIGILMFLLRYRGSEANKVLKPAVSGGAFEAKKGGYVELDE